MSAYSDAVQADSPISYWRFGEPSGTSATDMQGVNTGTYTGTVTLGTGGAPPGTNYDGDTAVWVHGGYVIAKAGAILAGMTNWSIEAWVVLSQAAADGDAIYCERGASGNDMLKLQAMANGAAQLAYRDDAGTLDTIGTASATLNTSQWKHVVVTKSGTAVTIYVNGVSAASGSLTATNTFTNTLSSRWGADAGAGSSNILAIMDEGALYSTALSGATVSSHYAVGTGSGASTSASAGAGTATGVAGASKASLKPSATTVTGTGAVSAVAFSLKPNAGNTAGTGTASAASAGSTVSATAGTTSGTGAAGAARTSLNLSAATATATGSAMSSTIGQPLAPHLTLDMNPRAAAPNASIATGTGVSSGMTGKASPTLAAVTGTGSVPVAGAKPAPNAVAATGTGIARVANGKVSAKATNAAGTGIARTPTVPTGGSWDGFLPVEYLPGSLT